MSELSGPEPSGFAQLLIQLKVMVERMENHGRRLDQEREERKELEQRVVQEVQKSRADIAALQAEFQLAQDQQVADRLTKLESVVEMRRLERNGAEAASRQPAQEQWTL